MTDITHKSNSLRKAIAEAIVVLSTTETIEAIRDLRVPKGNVLESARVAALFAVKRTSDMIPDCHPLPIEFAQVEFELSDSSIRVEVEVQTIYKTGVEVEAMHGAAVAALTIYDMLKPIDKGISIEGIRLLSKSGGKSDHDLQLAKGRRAAVVVCSDRISAGTATDKSGAAIAKRLHECGMIVTEPRIIPDDGHLIRATAIELCDQGVDLVVFCGGSGVSARDNSVEALSGIFEKTLDGIAEAMRAYGLQREARAMLSRSMAGIRASSLILLVPGSVRGALESIDAVIPTIFHVFDVIKNAPHDKA